MAKEKKSQSPDIFTVNGKSYRMLLQRVNIPDVGVRTAVEILVDTEAQQKLVEIGCIGTVIEEVI